MTGLMHEREFSRGRFLKGGGALIVGFSTLGAVLGAGSATAASNPTFESNGPFDSQQIDSWLTVHADNTTSMKLGMVELGQGSPTGLLLVAAEELNMDFSQMAMISND